MRSNQFKVLQFPVKIRLEISSLFTYIVSTLALVPCILPRIVPAFVFFTQPVIPILEQFSRQHFVKLQPVECLRSSKTETEILINARHCRLSSGMN